MNILVIGGGGREHALAWKLKQSSLCDNLLIAPGNPGTESLGQNIAVNINDFEAVKQIAITQNVDIVVVGPEDPLVNGITDFLKEASDWNGIVVGPSKEGAQLEGSKAYSKLFMDRHAIPTAAYAEFTKDNYEEGQAYIAKHTVPVVLKADGLAAGKGVVIAQTIEEAQKAFEEMIVNQQFGEASSKVVIEEFLDGIEVSVFVLTDGKDYKIIGHAKDYKRIGEGDKGLNTGGMGCVTPVPFMDANFMEKVETRIIQPTVNGLNKESIDYQGFIFFGLINIKGEPFVIEYNCRMGDPETEVVMPRLKTDLVSLIQQMANGELSQATIEYKGGAFGTVVAVSGGYPEAYEKGKKIELPTTESESIIFHAGTAFKDGNIVTSGGRVLTVTSSADDLKTAIEKSKKMLSNIHFEGMNYRSDIGYEFIA